MAADRRRLGEDVVVALSNLSLMELTLNFKDAAFMLNEKRDLFPGSKFSPNFGEALRDVALDEGAVGFRQQFGGLKIRYAESAGDGAHRHRIGRGQHFLNDLGLFSRRLLAAAVGHGDVSFMK